MPSPRRDAGQGDEIQAATKTPTAIIGAPQLMSRRNYRLGRVNERPRNCRCYLAYYEQVEDKDESDGNCGKPPRHSLETRSKVHEDVGDTSAYSADVSA